MDDIRACIGCNQACIGHFHKGLPVSCIQHPETGRELVYGTITPAPQSKRVMVIGGGPAGMKAAVTAAKGAVRMVKINVDQNQAIAAQLQIQSIPTVYAFFKGQPVDGFQGNVAPSEI